MSNSQGAPNVATAPATGTATVVVGCKLPHGLIIEVGKEGGDNYRKVKLNGMNASQQGGFVTHEGFGLTVVDESIWRAWMKKNEKLEFVRNGAVFEQKDEASAQAHSKASRGIITGFERLDASRPNVPGATDLGVSGDLDHLQRGIQDRIAMAS